MAESRVETIGATALKAITSNKFRTSLLIFNNSAANTVYFGFNNGLATTNGQPIRPYTGYAFSRETGDDPTLEYWLIASGAGTDVRITEQWVK
jgi:hypothetical protein